MVVEKTKNIGQVLLMAGIAGVIPILAFSAQYGGMKATLEDHGRRIEKAEEHINPTKDTHPPTDYRDLQLERIRALTERLRILTDQLRQHQEFDHGR